MLRSWVVGSDSTSLCGAGAPHPRGARQARGGRQLRDAVARHPQPTARGSPRPLRARPSWCWPVTTVEGAVVADQFGLCGDGRLFVAILCPVDKVFERGQAWHARRAALIGVQVYELARVRDIEDRVAKIVRLCLRELVEHRSDEGYFPLFASGLDCVGDHRVTHGYLLVRWGRWWFPVALRVSAARFVGDAESRQERGIDERVDPDDRLVRNFEHEDPVRPQYVLRAALHDNRRTPIRPGRSELHPRKIPVGRRLAKEP